MPWKEHILKTDVAAAGFKGIVFHELLFNGQRQILARYPNFDPSNPYGGGWAFVAGKMLPLYQDVPGDDKHTFHPEPQDIHRWAHPEEIEVFIFPRYNWWNNVVPIKSIDADSKTITLAGNVSYAIRPGDRYFFENALEELDAPGEWYLDRAGILYFWPPAPIDSKTVIAAPLVDSIIEADGVSKLTIKGLTLECAEDNGVVLKNCTDCIVAACTLRNIGTACTGKSSAINITGGDKCGAVGNDIHDVGSNAISIAGGVVQTLTPCGHYADNNYCHHFGQVYKQGVGVSLFGVGCRASHNLIHDGPRFGILFGGNKHLIEFNHVRHVDLETEDTGGLYCNGRDWLTSRGTVVRYNYIHDILGFGRRGGNGDFQSPYFSWGIYLDDDSAGLDLIGNIVARCVRGCVNLHNARDNLIENNVFVDAAEQQIQATGWDIKSHFWHDFSPTMALNWEKVKDQPAWKSLRGMDINPLKAPLPSGLIMEGNVCRKNIFYYHGKNSRLFSLVRVPLDHHTSDSNLVWHMDEPVLMQTAKLETWADWQHQGFDAHSEVADPLFVDAAHDDYHLKADSPATRLGFHPIPIDQIGPYRDPLRASWPIVEAEGAREKPPKIPPKAKVASKK